MITSKQLLTLVSITASCAQADITEISLNATTTVTYIPSVDAYDVVIDPHNSGNALVIIDSDGTEDTIRKITILDNSFLSGNLVQLFIWNTSAPLNRSSIQGIEEIVVVNGTETDVLLQSLIIEGSVGVEGSSKSIRTYHVGSVNIGGNLYAPIIAEGSQLLGGNSSLRVGGDVLGGGFLINTGGISLVNILGDVDVAGMRKPTFWSKLKLIELKVDGNFNGRVGRDPFGFSPLSDVGTIDVGGDFKDIGEHMFMNTLDRLECGGDLDAEITFSNKAANGTVLNIGGSFIAGTDPNNQNFLRFPDGSIIEQSIINSNNVGGE